MSTAPGPPPFAEEDMWPGADHHEHPDRRKLPPGIILGVIVVVLLAVAMIVAMTRPGRGVPPPNTSSSPSSSRTPTPTSTVINTLPPAPGQPQLTLAIDQLEKTYSVSLGVAIAPIARAGEATVAPWYAGSLATGPAWSTSTAPVALAVLRGQRQPEDLDYLLNRAVVESSSAGEDALYTFLGTPTEAASQINKVFRDAADPITTIPDEASVRAGVSAPHQMLWGVRSQAQFAGTLYCMPDSWQLLTKMDDQPSTDRWGLGMLGRTQFLNGFGPEPNGVISVRQMAVATLADGSKVGVSVIAMATDGTFLTSQRALNEVAPLIFALAKGFGGHTCSG